MEIRYKLKRAIIKKETFKLILTAHQPVYLPWLGLFHKIALADEFVYFEDVQYTKKDYVSRNIIKGINGPILLTVPVLNKNHFEKKISEVKINNAENWAKKHWKSIYLNYKKAPYFSQYSDFFEYVYSKEWEYLTDLNYEMLLWFLDVLGIKTKVRRMSDYTFTGEKSDLVLDMCKQLKCDMYIFGKLGIDYADVNAFKENNIKLYFQNYNCQEYSQQYMQRGFEPYMSVIDLLFNEGNKSYDIIMKNNVSKEMLL